MNMETLLSPMVQVVLDKVCTSMLNRAQAIAKFQKEFEQLEKGLNNANNLLADSMTLQSKYKEVEDALSQLREVIDEAENVLTDCLMRDIYKENKPFLSSLSCWIHDPGFKSRVSKQLLEINSKMDKAHSILSEHLKSAKSVATDRVVSETDREFNSRNYVPSVTYGLDEHIESLKRWMHSSNKGKLDFVGIVGMGGLGKTTIAKKFFTDTQVISHFNKMIWVSVSQNFSSQRILKCMLENVNLALPDDSNSNNLFTTLKQGLEDQAYLIVMDDAWLSANLRHFWTNLEDSLPTKVDKSSCIMITTRNREVATSLVNKDSLILQPPTLNDEHGWSLFTRFAFRSTEGKCPGELEEDGRAIVKRCGGLPLAIKTVGGYLANENRLFEWTKTREKFHSLTTDEKTESLMLSLRLSYDELPTDMKQCLLCLSVYPEDFEIHADQLIQWWFTEGLIRGKKGETSLELGYEYLAKLANRCLLEVVESRGYDGRIYKFKIHDMVRELIIKIAETEKFCNFSKEGTQIEIEDSRWLCLTEDMPPAEVKKRWTKRNSKLRALLLMSSLSLIDFSKNFVLLESLRVLDLSYSKLDVINVEDSNTASSGNPIEKLFAMITSLKRLACLNLSGVEKLFEVPSSVVNLLNLQVLVLNGCKDLSKINANITSLKRLVVLDIGTCPLQNLPRDLGSLYNLQELSGFRVVSQTKNTGGCTLLELGKLKQLRVLRIIIGDVAKISDKEKKCLSSLQNLKVIAIDAADTREQENLEMVDELELPKQIEELYLRSYRSPKMPNWFGPLNLPKLHYLSVEDCDVQSLKDNYGWKIEGLYLKLLQMLVADWKDLKMRMPALRYMEISQCSSLKNFPKLDSITGIWRK